jgi:hypothetical protein
MSPHGGTKWVARVPVHASDVQMWLLSNGNIETKKRKADFVLDV